MNKKVIALLSAAAMMISGTACSENNKSSSEKKESSSAVSQAQETTEKATEEETTEAPTEHVSPKQTVTAEQSVQITVDKTIQRTEGSNTIQLPLADFIEDGDVITSFTFVIYSGDGTSNIGEFKGGCGISVTDGCNSATDEGWYQSEDFSAPTQGTYG